jgi:hypothetical protein
MQIARRFRFNRKEMPVPKFWPPLQTSISSVHSSKYMGLIFKDTDNKPVDPKVARLRAILLSLPFAIMGIFALVLLLHDGLLGGLNRQKTTGLLSAAAVCGGLIALIFGITAKKQALKIGAMEIDREKPWLNRKEWADGRIASTGRKAVLLLWIFVAFWCAASAAISFAVVPQQLHQGNRAALIALIFPVIGLAMMFFALNTTRAWRTFGRSIFAMAAVPATPGGTLTGEIQVGTKLSPQHGWHLCLSCVRRTTTGASNNRQTHDEILWSDEKWLRPGLPQTGSNATGIPVFFKLPDNLPESAVATGDGIHWQLEASAKLRGPDFHAAFDVPVFKVAEAPAPADDPTVPYQMSLDELRQKIHSRNQVNDLPGGGREFIFPAARNPGFASGATVVCLIWTGIILLLLWNRAPFLFLFIFSVIDLLMTAFVLDLWFRRSRVAVNPESVTVQRAWLAFKKEQRLPAGEIASVTSEVGATAGHAVYHDLKARARDGRELLLAKNLNSKPEADWLARQMMAALKRPA